VADDAWMKALCF